MPHSKKRGGRTSGGAGLGVDTLDVGLGRLCRDPQGESGLSGGCAASDQGENLDLARGEPSRANAALRPVLSGSYKHGIHGVGRQAPGPDLLAQFASGLRE